ncbi:hypothetical protein D5086_018426 [Populus alba]|uniref:Uncharacterized protein n=3 Tax=Populus TaxID=3689 RepID=A0ACC4BQW0_POPAL|nr:uncharacterized protein LOC118058720 [Populus alba]KAJ6985451.1 hypothetical protein NC653_023413 [Populus alba x Populus x berolinensis]TKS05314.1 hypothetical protein D5086_0000134110 [Populus alba]
MGNTCSSCESTSVVTANLIYEDGKLEEFSYSIRVSQILQRNPACFVCKADDMGFDEYVSAINQNEYLQLGHLYFVLPSSWLNNPLRTEQMAALAVKASLALKMGNGGGDGCWCRIKRLDPVIEWTSKSTSDETSPTVATGTHHDGGGFFVKRRGRAGGGERKSTTKLSAILEE